MAEATSAEQQQAGTTLEAGDFQSLLKKEFKPKTDRAREQVEAAVKTLAEHVLQDKDLIADDAVNSINALIAEIDKKLTDQVNAVLHHPDFQQMEGTWRGLKHLVFNTESSEKLKIKIFNVSKKELGKTLKRYPGTSWDLSPVFKKV
jgi:type VI secretion system protein ImpC